MAQKFSFFDDVQVFYPVLDGEKHTMKTWWNFAGERWFFVLTDSAGNLAMNAPLVEGVNMLEGYFNSSMNYDAVSQTITVA